MRKWCASQRQNFVVFSVFIFCCFAAQRQLWQLSPEQRRSDEEKKQRNTYYIAHDSRHQLTTQSFRCFFLFLYFVRFTSAMIVTHPYQLNVKCHYSLSRRVQHIRTTCNECVCSEFALSPPCVMCTTVRWCDCGQRYALNKLLVLCVRIEKENESNGNASIRQSW